MKTLTFICYERCSTCKKAKAWLEAQGLSFTVRPIKEENPTAAELAAWHRESGLPLKRFVNTSGLLYKELQLKDKLPAMTDDEIYALLATDGMLVKRPLLLIEAGDSRTVLPGFREEQWQEALQK